MQHNVMTQRLYTLRPQHLIMETKYNLLWYFHEIDALFLFNVFYFNSSRGFKFKQLNTHLSIHVCLIVITVLLHNLMYTLTKRQFAFVVGHSVQQGDSATRIAKRLLEEIDLGRFCNLVCLLLSEWLMLPCTPAHTGRVFFRHLLSITWEIEIERILITCTISRGKMKQRPILFSACYL